MVGETVDGGGYSGVGGGCSDGCEAADGSGDGQIVSQLDQTPIQSQHTFFVRSASAMFAGCGYC